MGGKNHQPCKTYLANSTRLSRHLSLAYARLEFGNAALEDILLDELGMKHVSGAAAAMFDQIEGELGGSLRELRLAQQAVASLRQQMDETGFADLPTLGKIDLSQIGHNLAKSGMVNLAAWQQVQQLMTGGGFYVMLDQFDTDISGLMELTAALQTKFSALKPAIIEGSLTDIVEENRPESFKPEFAAVYTAWTEFNALFLASSLMSTELWYAFTDKGSLAPDATVQLRAA